MRYEGTKTNEISFPLGGIGTGSISLSGNGRLIDWEIMNKPNKGSTNGFSFFAIKAERDGRLIDARILNGDLHPPFTGNFKVEKFSGYGFGPASTTMAGFPHFEEHSFVGEFPAARLEFAHKAFPGAVALQAFNPFIPLNDEDSSIPAAFFEVEITNHTAQSVDYTLAAVLGNPFGDGAGYNTHIQEGTVQMIQLSSRKPCPDEIAYGDISIATGNADTSWQEYLYRGQMFDTTGVFWTNFISSGKLENRVYDTPTGENRHDACCLASHVQINPGETRKIRYVIAWNFPNCENYWRKPGDDGIMPGSPENQWKNYYAGLFQNSRETCLYALQNWERLYRETMSFKNILFTSSMPEEIIDAVSANISILKTPTCMRLEDGSFYGWEGCQCYNGSCHGSCTHVWNYAYALPFLFPKLERSMRTLHYRHDQHDNGGMAFRIQLPPGSARTTFSPCADGQFGDIIKVYRDWKISGDTEWLKSVWEPVKRSIAYAYSPDNPDRWDLDKDGVLEGRQHHTLDMELFGPNSWLTGFYLAALKAASEMAAYLGDTVAADEYSALFAKGQKWVEENLWNGEYYYQKLDLTDKSVLEPYAEAKTLFKKTTIDSYWNDETGEINYQLGEGCSIDQVIAQWHANLCGLGRIFDADRTKTALASIHKYNYKACMRDHFNPCRLFALNNEAGTVICDWHGKQRPAVPAPYTEETWSGCEYQAAAHMIQEGLVDEGLKTVAAVRGRYDGEKRNPWNEMECGSNYARSMASYSLLLAWSGFQFDLVRGHIGWKPVRISGAEFRCFWSVGSGWGQVVISEKGAVIHVEQGKLALRSLFAGENTESTKKLILNNTPVAFRLENSRILFDEIIIKKGQSLEAVFAG